jgi:hypothetical protein
MFKSQFKLHSPFGVWQTIGSYGSEGQAIATAIRQKVKGAIMVRVVDRRGGVIYSN